MPRERCSPGTYGPRRRLGTWQAFSCGRVGSPGFARKRRQLDHVTQQCGGTCPARFLKVAMSYVVSLCLPMPPCRVGRAQSYQSPMSLTPGTLCLASCDGSKRQTTVSPPDLILECAVLPTRRVRPRIATPLLLFPSLTPGRASRVCFSFKLFLCEPLKPMAARQYVALALQLNLFPGLAVLRDGEKRKDKLL